MRYCERCNNFFSDDSEICPNDQLQLSDFELKQLVGKTIDGKYLVEKLLGVGGMGAVFRARHTFINNDVAIKVIHPQLAIDRSIVERFLREARAAATIDHPNAIRVSDFGRVGDMLYLVMEFIQGSSMKDYLETKGCLTISETAKILSQVCAALDVAHSYQIVHRDLKPDNIMLKQNQRGEMIVKVVDFGIAKVKANDSQNEALTNVGMIIGTASYMSPEQCQGAIVDWRSDIYSLGVIAFEAITGQRPFTAPSAMQVIVKHIVDPPPTLRSFCPEVPIEIERVVLRALEKHPADRYESAGEFALALSAAVTICQLDEPIAKSNLQANGRYQTVNLDNEKTMIKPANMVIATSDNGKTVIDAVEPAVLPTNGNRTVIGAVSQPQQLLNPNHTIRSVTSVKSSVNTQADANGEKRKKPKLLIVIDSRAIVMLLKHQLQQAGFEVITVLESIEATVTALREQPDLMILGMDMPHLSGPELCTLIKTKPSMAEVARVPILLYSSLGEKELAEKADSCQADGYIHKTWNVDRITSHLNSFLNQ
ncbi:MAG: protein kinase [Acidobacteriota bacterium]